MSTQTWNDVLNFWELQVAATEQALATNSGWDVIANRDIALSTDLGPIPESLLERYETLRQRTQAVEQQIVERSGPILEELTTIAEFKTARSAVANNVVGEPRYVDSRA